MSSNFLEKFCTVPFRPLSDFDFKSISNAERFEIPFEGQTLQCYSWGSGKTILLVHGWGSRASHLAPLARVLSSTGFKVVAFDAPAHSSQNNNVKKYSNMFELCRAVYAVFKKLGNVYAAVGHSLGAASSAFDAAGYMLMADYKIEVEKLVLISCPANLKNVIKSFCKNNGLNSHDEIRLTKELEEDFSFLVENYSVTKAIKNINSKILIIHDADDEEIPVGDAKELCEDANNAHMYLTKGSGHDKILINRSMLAKVKEFLIE